MKFLACHSTRHRKGAAGFTLIEMMTAVGLGIVLMVGVAILYINGNECFVAMANYQNLDKYSCNALDILGREIRGASAVTATNQTSITLTNATLGRNIQITFNSTNGTLVLKRTGYSDVTNLTGCNSWSYALFMGVPNTNSFATNIVFYAATNTASAKVIQMNWKCTRTYLGYKLTTESVQTAQIVLRNETAQ